MHLSPAFLALYAQPRRGLRDALLRLVRLAFTDYETRVDGGAL